MADNKSLLPIVVFHFGLENIFVFIFQILSFHQIVHENPAEFKNAMLKAQVLHGAQFCSCSFSGGGGVRVCGDAVLRYFWCSFAVIFILTRGIAVSRH